MVTGPGTSNYLHFEVFCFNYVWDYSMMKKGACMNALLWGVICISTNTVFYHKAYVNVLWYLSYLLVGCLLRLFIFTILTSLGLGFDQLLVWHTHMLLIY